MPKSVRPRNKLRQQGSVFPTRKIPPKPKWMQVVKATGFTLLALLMLVAMVLLIIKHFRHA